MKKNDMTFVGLSMPKAMLLCGRSTPMTPAVHKNLGMTLLELVIVVALLSIVALASTSLIIDTGEWKKQQITEDQWLSVKRSIIGDNVVDAHSRREYSGFVADMGRLPNCMRELIRPYDCEPDLDKTDAGADDANRLTTFTQDTDSNQWYGWRGPYLGVPGTNEYRDGWRNQGRDDNTGNDDDVDYGWLFGTGAVNGTECQNAVVEQTQPGTLFLQSCGVDKRVDNTETGFVGDFPYVEFDAADNPIYIPLLGRHDYQVDIGNSWVSAPLTFKPTNVNQSRIIPANSLRLKINYPVTDGRIPDWADNLIDNATKRDNAPFLSALFPANARRLVDATGKVYTGDDGDSDFLTDGAAEDVIVPVGTALSGSLVTVPGGVSSPLTFTAGSGSILELQNCPCELLVSSLTTPTLSGTTLDSVETIAIKPENIAPIVANISKYMIEVPQGAIVNSLTSFTLPNGATLTLSRAADTAYFPKLVLDIDGGAPPTVTVSEGITMTGDLVETDSSKDQFLVAPEAFPPVGNVITLEPSVPTIPQGLRNITVVCESGPVGFEGFLYDGNCADNDSSHNPIATPYQLEVSPRSYVPVPNAIGWRIQ